MVNKLYPDLYINTLTDVPLEQLQAWDKKAFILDLDNTITEWNSNDITKEVLEWFITIKQKGFKAVILSNNGEQRIVKVAEQLGIPFLHRAQKPRRGAFYRAVEILGVNLEQTVVIGDQIFTDILGGNRAGFYTILVVPLNKREFPGTKISRMAEYFVLKSLKKKPRNNS